MLAIAARQCQRTLQCGRLPFKLRAPLHQAVSGYLFGEARFMLPHGGRSGLPAGAHLDHPGVWEDARLGTFTCMSKKSECWPLRGWRMPSLLLYDALFSCIRRRSAAQRLQSVHGTACMAPAAFLRPTQHWLSAKHQLQGIEYGAIYALHDIVCAPVQAECCLQEHLAATSREGGPQGTCTRRSSRARASPPCWPCCTRK